MTAAVLPDNATDKSVKWSVTEDAVTLYSDEACEKPVGSEATETFTVYARGISEDSATVTVTSNADSTKSASCTRTVTDSSDVIAEIMSEVSAKTGSGMTYTGNPIQLINKPPTALPNGYTMKYAVSTENKAPTDDNLYTTSIPTATDSGT